MPHPDGLIQVQFQKKGKDGIAGTIDLPKNLTGAFVWKGKSIPLTSGTQQFNLK